MDLKGLRGSGTVFDIESGITATEDPTGGVKQEKQLLNSVWSGFVNADRLVTGEEAGSIGNVLVSQVDMPTANGESLKNLGGEENVGVVWKIEDEKPKRKKKACRKAPKPPRPPRAPSLDASDQKLIREISELALLKRARIERMKALRKMKNAKASSSKSNFCALVITILFCLVIFWQGFCSRSHSSVRFEGSPESSVGTRAGLISIQHFKNVSPSANDSTSASPDMAEPVPGSGFYGEGGGRTAG